MTTSKVTASSPARVGQHGPSVLVLECTACPGRRTWLEERTRVPGARSFVLACDFDQEGPWDGVRDMLLALLPDIQTQRPDLLERHSVELTAAVPRLRESMAVPHRTLTDVAPEGEKVRGYPADRALRNVHGLIDLIDAWKRSTEPDTLWKIACDGFDKAGSMSRHFFRELMRRRGCALHLEMIVAVDPAAGHDICTSFDPSIPTEIFRLDLPRQAETAQGRAESLVAAVELEHAIGDDPVEREWNLHRLIQLWGAADRQDKVLHLKRDASWAYFHDGLYADALRCNEGLLEMAVQYAPGDEDLHREIIIRRLNALIGLQDVRSAVEVLEKQALPIADKAPFQWQADLYYLAAMVYGRYSKPRQLERGEAYLDRSLEALKEIGLSEEKYYFQYVFNRNGVAMIRNFQHRAQDALELCRQNVELLNEHVRAEKHKLHRSVLIYNTGQVYLAIGKLEDALEYYSRAIAMDPNFSEYYNERGSILLKLDRLSEAEADFRKAIDLSPPYYEVFTNLAQCYRKMGRYDAAIDSYSRALDLEPKQVLALVGRGQAQELSGGRDGAILDYTMALSYEPEQWEVLANRGVLHYEGGNSEAALQDFNAAIRLAPNQVSLHQNRALLLSEMGQTDAALRDLATAETLCGCEPGPLSPRQQLDELRRKIQAGTAPV